MQSVTENLNPRDQGFLAGGGEMGALIRAFDWSSTPLGPLENWPQSLKTTVGMMIAAPNPIVLLWGWEGVLIYNDGYARFAGRRHPQLLGKGAREGWPEIADFNDNIIRTVLGGESISLKAQELVLDRAGTLEPGWMDLDYTPVPDETGKPAAVLVFVTEITEQMKAEQRASEEAARQRRMLQQMPGFTAILTGREHRFDYVNNAYVDVSGGDRDFIGRNIREVFPELAGQGIYELLDRVYQTGERFVASDMRVRLARADGERVLNFIYEPIRDDQQKVIGIFVGGYDITEAHMTARHMRALADLGDRIRDIEDPDELAYAAAEILGRTLGVSRAGYGTINVAEETITIQRDWNMPGVQSLAGVLHFRDYGSYIEDLKRGETVVFADAEKDPRTAGNAAALKAISAQSVVNMPVTEQGGFVALLYLNHAEAREWTDGELNLIRDVAERTRTAVQRRLMETALRASEARQASLVTLNDTLRDLTDIGEISYAASQILNSVLGGNRAVYATVGPDRESIVTDRDWSETGVDSIAGTLKLRDYGTFVKNLQAGETVLVNDVRTDPRTRDFVTAHAARRVTSFMISPVMERGELVAIMSVSSAEPRAWLPEEAEFLQGVAERTRTTVERARATTAALESGARYEALFSAMDEGFCIIEFIDGPEGPLSDYVHVEANAAYAKNAGIPNVVGQKVRAMVGAEAQGWIDLYKGVLDTGQPIRFEKELEATQRWLELSAFRVEPKTRNQVAVLFKDLTARKQAEQALRDLNATLEQRVASALAERRLLADIIQSADAFVQVADTDLRWMAINEASAAEFERIYGVRPKVGDSMMETLAHLPEQAAAVETIWRRAIAEAPFVEVQEFGDDRFDRRFYEMRFYPLLDETGERIGAYQIVYDVTDRLNEQARMREMEEVLRQSQKMEAVGQLTGGIAHDFNNLLGGISGSLELLEKRIAEGRLEGVQRYITSAQEGSRRAASLTQRLLAFSRRQTLDPKPIDANKLIAGMEDLIRRSVGPTVTVEVVQAGGLWATRVDPSQLENSLLNLCINARDAMAPDGGRLTIETANKWLDERAAKERELPPGQYISICVTDTGTGMPPDVIARVFDPFFTTKPLGQGTGLGLSMVYGFVRQSNGQVRVYSEVGKGTTMCLYLPRHFGAVDEAQSATHDETIDKGAGETVLVIDDEPILRMLVIDVLEENGYRALEAVDGPSGLRVLESDARIDLLVTDVGLPGGMNGRQVADAARRLRPDLKVLFITGYAENAVIGNGHLEPGMEVLTKPFPVSTLGQRIRDMIERK